MIRPRVIPCLLIHEDGLVKTKKFKEFKYVGDPINAVRIFNEKKADELIVLDIDATVTGNEPNYQRIAHLAAECRMPLCYGGGIRTAAQAKKIISLGVEKVAVSAIAMESPEVLKQIAEEVGRQSVVVVVDVKKKSFSKKYEVWTHNAKKNTKTNVIDVLKEIDAIGVGEVVINFVDNDGCMEGFSIDAIASFKQYVHVPFTVIGGAGSLQDMGDVISRCGLMGIAAGSLFVFKGPYKAVLINYPNLAQKQELIYEKFDVYK